MRFCTRCKEFKGDHISEQSCATTRGSELGCEFSFEFDQTHQVFCCNAGHFCWPVHLRHSSGTHSMFHWNLGDAQVGGLGSGQELPPEPLLEDANVTCENFFQSGSAYHQVWARRVSQLHRKQAAIANPNAPDIILRTQ